MLVVGVTSTLPGVFFVGGDGELKAKRSRQSAMSPNGRGSCLTLSLVHVYPGAWDHRGTPPPLPLLLRSPGSDELQQLQLRGQQRLEITGTPILQAGIRAHWARIH